MVKLLLVKKRTKTGNESMYLVDKKFVIKIKFELIEVISSTLLR